MPNLGVVDILMKRESWGKGVKVLVYFWEERRAERVVNSCPVGGMNCRGSLQMIQLLRVVGLWVENWVPQVEQIRRSDEVDMVAAGDCLVYI